MSNTLLECSNLTKIYPGGILANHNVNFSINEGEIHALVGENGAGKSTLMKMLFGIEEVTSGDIFLRGEKVKIISSKDAISRGIGMVHQHMKLVPSLTVSENLLLGIEPKKGIFIDKKECIRITNEISEKYKLHVDATKKVRDISVSMKQKLEILKTMYRGAKIIILDEPTAVLTPQETKELFEQLTNMKNEGFTIIFISHKLNEVKQLCDRLTVLKQGKTLGTYNMADVSTEEISRLMVGRDVVFEYDKSINKSFEKILEVKDLMYVDKFGSTKINKMSLSLRRGEVLGIASIEGNGQKETMDIITGLLKPDSGEVIFKGSNITSNSIKAIREKGIAHIPEDRHYNGCADTLSVTENISATNLKSFTNRLGLVNQTKINEHTSNLVEQFKVKTSSNKTSVKSLSGGNIQKVIVAREFSADADVIIINQPTRGIDIGAQQLIHNKIIDMSKEGKSMIIVSSDLTELLALSDRIVIVSEGHVVGNITDVKNTTDEDLGLYMLGIKEDSPEILKEA